MRYAVLLALAWSGCECGDHVAEIVSLNGRAERDHAASVDRWERAQVGARFAIGDGVRTKESSRSELALGESGARLRLGESTTIRFMRHPRQGIGLDVSTGSAVLEAGDEAIDLTTSFGDALVDPGGQIRITPRGDGLDVSVVFGRAVLDGREAQEGLAVRFGAAVEEQAPPEPVAVDAGPPPPPPVVNGGTVVQRQAGRGATLRASDGAPWQPIEDAEIAVAPGARIRVPARASVAIRRGDARSVLEGRGEYVVSESGLVRAESGVVSVAAGSAEVTIEVPGGTIVVRAAEGQSNVRLDVRARGTDVGVEQGEADVRGTVDQETLAAGERAVLTPAGEIETVAGRGPAHADFAIGAGATITVHDPRPPTAIGLRFSEQCAGRGIVEIMRGGSAAMSSSGSGQANVLLNAGAHSYRVRCAGGGDPITGTLRVVRDSGIAPLPPSAPRTMVDADGRNYRVMYQTHIPDITVRWPRPPATGPYTLTIRGPGQPRSMNSTAPRFELASGTLATGTYTLELRAGTASARPTTLEIRFDNAMPTASIRSPGDRSFSAGETVHVSGIAVAGWSASVDGVNLPLDPQLRFEGDVTAPSHALAIELRHPSRGRHIYLRRPREAAP